MKKLLLLSLLPLLPMALIANGTDHKAINKQITEIKPPRKGVELVDVIRVKSPFILLKRGKNGVKTTYTVKKKVKRPHLMMESSINNKVKINGKWYKEGDRIRQYTIIDVSVGEVLLKSKRDELKLHLNHANDKIKFKVN